MRISATAVPMPFVRISLLLLMLFVSGASAQSGFRIAAGAGVTGPLAANLHAVLPVFTFGEGAESLVLAARADTAFVFGGMPAFGVSAVVLGDYQLPVQPYLGFGAGLSFPARSVLVTPYGMAGVNVRIAAGWGAFLETQFSTGPVGPRLHLGLGASYTFGGR